VGWVAGPEAVITDLSRAHIYNVVTPVGIAQAGALAALQLPEEEIEPCVHEWQRRRDMVIEQLRGFAVTPAAGGWSLLWNVAQLGLDSFAASQRLLEKGRIAATPMRDWGERNSDQFVRLVFSNETVDRLSDLRRRVNLAF
jgi:N-succinyldiaminopimelate aminotransferase